MVAGRAPGLRAAGLGTLVFRQPTGARAKIAALFVAYALLYPGLVALTGHAIPRAPAFAVPCPTALFTAGMLASASPAAPRHLLAVPAAWSLIGGTAALSPGVTPDLMLFAATVLIAGRSS